ncbi:MAG: hopanoid biosynthesis-associated protein HpnK [Limisphaerales bacterium]
MASARARRRLIVNADDFGQSASINQAVIQAHQQGILTSASLMVNGDAFEAAVDLAKTNPRLGVGLHLTLCCGRATLPAAEIPDLVTDDGLFAASAIAAGIAYYCSRGLRGQLRREMQAQIEKFQETGLRMDHLNGHLHIHLHPTILALLVPELTKDLQCAMRLTNEPIAISWGLGRGRWFYRLSHALIFRSLSRRAESKLREHGIRHTEQIFGLLEDSRVTEEFIMKLLAKLPDGDSELYSHPSLDEFPHEYEALVSPRVKTAIAEHQIELIRYQDL